MLSLPLLSVHQPAACQDRYPLLSQSSSQATWLLRRPTLVPVFANRKKSEKEFCFYKKRRKVQIALFGREPLWRRRASCRESGRRAPSPDPPRRPAGNCVREQLRCVPSSAAHPFARWRPQVAGKPKRLCGVWGHSHFSVGNNGNCFLPFRHLAYEGFPGARSFQRAGGACVGLLWAPPAPSLGVFNERVTHGASMVPSDSRRKRAPRKTGFLLSDQPEWRTPNRSLRKRSMAFPAETSGLRASLPASAAPERSSKSSHGRRESAFSQPVCPLPPLTGFLCALAHRRATQFCFFLFHFPPESNQSGS